MNTNDPLLAALLAAAEEMDGNELENVICALAEVRQRTLPAVPGTMHALKASGTTPPVSMENEPAMECTQKTDGSVLLWARSSGFGWIAFSIPHQNACTLRDWLAANVQGEPDIVGMPAGGMH